MSRVVVTSMSQKYFDMSGLTWLNSLCAHNPGVTPYIVSEDMPQSLYIQPIHRAVDYKNFIAEAQAQELSKDPTNYRWQARRFCHKVFAVEQAFYSFTDDDIYWFDADVEFTGKIDFDVLQPPDGGVTTLGRTVWPHTEGGFIGFSGGAYDVVDMWLEFYLSGCLFNLQEWHDMYAFDMTLALTKCSNKNLSANIPLKHVWPETPLASFSAHHKGPGRKLDVYGSNEAIRGAVLQSTDDVKE